MKFGADECRQTSQCLENKAEELDKYPKNHGNDLDKLDSEHREVFHKCPDAAVQADKRT